jgi:hypothetical protein
MEVDSDLPWPNDDCVAPTGLRIATQVRRAKRTLDFGQVAVGRPFRAPKGTGLLTFRRLLIRDSESFGEEFRGAAGTLKFPFGPQKFSLETESATPFAGSSQTLARTGQERETPGSRSLDDGR